MPFKFNISEHGKAWKLELTNEFIIGKSIGEKIHGKDLSSDLEGYEFQITGASDMSGFPHKSDIDGPELKRVLLTRGWGMHDNTEGMRRRKTVRGKQISEKTSQINVKVLKEGHKKLHDVFPDQNKPKEKKVEATPAAA